jgi:galactokinase
MIVTSSTPGRICLFGEHQDYLGMPVVAAAISLRATFNAQYRTDSHIVIHKPDINQTEIINLTGTRLPYVQGRDYSRSAVNVLMTKGFSFSRGFDTSLTSNIPINAGTSSSSAILVAWINLLSQMADNPQKLSSKTIAELAYQAEVVEFNEAGGMMDQYSTAIGNVIYLESDPEIVVEPLSPRFGTFVLGNSHTPKDTQGILGFVKGGMLKIIEKIKEINPNFSIHTCTELEVAEYKDLMSKDEYLLLKANVNDRDILREGLTLLKADNLDNQRFGQLLSEHHVNLSKYKKISTPKIDGMITAALKAGALGAKINGSGGGGCMFAYAPHKPEAVKEAIEQAGGEAFIINIEVGVL